MITKFILKEYIPLLTKGVHSVELDLSGVVNILIGKNGHGKSRILAELNELPPENKHFEEGGYKLIERRHLGKLYRMESYTGAKSKHSFTIDGGENLNPGGTQTVQRDLVRMHLGVTPLVTRALAGLRVQDCICGMPDNVRKNVFMELYPNDTRYAMSVYNKLKAAMNDAAGAIKNQTRRLAEESHRSNVLSEMTTSELEMKIGDIDKTLSDALFIQGSLSGVAKQNPTPELEEQITRLKRLIQSVTSYNLTTPLYTKNELRDNLERTQNLIGHHKDKIKLYQFVIDEISSKMSNLKGNEYDPALFEAKLVDLTARVAENDRELTALHDRVHEDDALFSLYESGHHELVDVIPTFIRQLNTVVLASSPNITQDSLRAVHAKIEEVTNLGRHQKELLIEEEHKLKHFNSTQSVDCPECKASFKPGFETMDVDGVNRNIARLNQSLDQLRAQRAALMRQYELDKEFDHSFTRLMQYVNAQGHHTDVLLQLIKEHDIGYSRADNLINALNSFQRAVVLSRTNTGLTEELKIIKGRVALLKSNNMVEIHASYQQTETLLEGATVSLQRCIAKYEAYEDQLTSYEAYEFKMGSLQTVNENILNLLVEEGRWNLRRTIVNVINEVGPEKDQLITSLIRKQSTQAVVQSIEENLAALKKRHAQLKILTDGLCPKKGKIGKMMLDFNTTVCANVNAEIQEVWSTPLFVKPCVSDKGEIDYKFPVINGVKNSKADDVSECSGGEQEIIDYAFRKVWRKYHASSTPLVLDEVGVKMDEYHRRRFFDRIMRTTVNGDEEQLFIVSHYYSQYGMLDGANIIALNTEGLTVPANLNQHSKISYS